MYNIWDMSTYEYFCRSRSWPSLAQKLFCITAQTYLQSLSEHSRILKIRFFNYQPKVFISIVKYYCPKKRERSGIVFQLQINSFYSKDLQLWHLCSALMNSQLHRVSRIHITNVRSQRGTRGISDIPPRHSRFTKMT
jgi:hypothetical protein